MTRFLAFLSCLILLLGMCIGVSAKETTDVYASAVSIFATVSYNGTCDVSTNVTIHTDATVKDLTFPVPITASNVTLNGKPVLTEKSGSARLVSLSRIIGNMPGDYSFSVGFTLSSTIHSLAAEATQATEATEADTLPTYRRLQLELPLLAGFSYPIEELQFSINLPGEITQPPRFVSGYHQSNIEKDLTYSVSGANIAGRNWNTIKDHETLTMFMDTNDAMFPQTRADLPVLENVTNLIGICVGVAFVYWLLFLRNILPIRLYPAVAPEGFGAGQLGTILTEAGTDLSLMVFSWAQLGYVILQMDRRGRVLIHKRMEMGNERNAFEQKCFHMLFSRRDVVDASGAAYRKLFQSVKMQYPARQLFRKKGILHTKIFRCIVAIAGLLSGACFGIILGNMLDYGWFFMMILSVVGLLCSWHIQFWPEGVFLHHSLRLWTASILSILWLAIGIVIQQAPLALLAVAIQFFAGFLATFGGRRTEDGHNAMGQTLSLRRYYKKLSEEKIRYLCQNNPDLFFDLAPNALALGCDKRLARRFGAHRLPSCPYIRVSNSQGLTAKQWSQLMRQILGSMATRQKKRPLENLNYVLDNYMK